MDKTATPDRSSTNPIQVIESMLHLHQLLKSAQLMLSPNNSQYLRLQVEVGVVTEEKEREVEASK